LSWTPRRGNNIRAKKKPTRERQEDGSHNQKKRDPNRHCKHCDVDGHMEEKCWKLHLELHPKWLKSKRKEKETTETKEEVVESTSDLDEAIVCTTLQ
jgi:hypothetical protein